MGRRSTKIFIATAFVVLAVGSIIILKSVSNRTQDATLTQPEPQNVKLFDIPPEHQNISNIVISPDEKRIVYSATDKAGKRFVVYNKIEGVHYYNVGSFQFSPDSKHFAYIGSTQDGWKIIMDGKESEKTYKGRVFFQFSPNSKDFFIRWEKSWQEEYIIINGQENGPYSDISSVVFSPDGLHFAYSTLIGESVPLWSGITKMVIDGTEYGPYRSVGDFIIHEPVFSPDSKHVAYGANFSDGESALVLDGVEKRFGVPSSVGNVMFTSENGLIYSVQTDPGLNTAFFVINDKTYAGKPSNFIFSPKMSRLAYFLDYPILVVDGVKKGPVSSTPTLGGFKFSKDDKHFIYVEKEGTIIVDDNKYEYIPEGLIIETYISDNGKRIALQELSNNFKKYAHSSRIVIDKTEGCFYEEISDFSFSPNGEHFAYRADHKIILNNDELAEYGEALTKPQFIYDSKYVSFVAKIGNGLWQVVKPTSQKETLRKCEQITPPPFS